MKVLDRIRRFWLRPASDEPLSEAEQEDSALSPTDARAHIPDLLLGPRASEDEERAG
jgi:hypothetical protein